jgi:hypothetical protein
MNESDKSVLRAMLWTFAFIGGLILVCCIGLVVIAATAKFIERFF